MAPLDELNHINTARKKQRRIHKEGKMKKKTKFEGPTPQKRAGGALLSEPARKRERRLSNEHVKKALSEQQRDRSATNPEQTSTSTPKSTATMTSFIPSKGPEPLQSFTPQPSSDDMSPSTPDSERTYVQSPSSSCSMASEPSQISAPDKPRPKRPVRSKISTIDDLRYAIESRTSMQKLPSSKTGPKRLTMKILEQAINVLRDEFYKAQRDHLREMDALRLERVREMEDVAETIESLKADFDQKIADVHEVVNDYKEEVHLLKEQLEEKNVECGELMAAVKEGQEERGALEKELAEMNEQLTEKVEALRDQVFRSP